MPPEAEAVSKVKNPPHGSVEICSDPFYKQSPAQLRRCCEVLLLIVLVRRAQSLKNLKDYEWPERYRLTSP